MGQTARQYHVEPDTARAIAVAFAGARPGSFTEAATAAVAALAGSDGALAAVRVSCGSESWSVVAPPGREDTAAFGRLEIALAGNSAFADGRVAIARATTTGTSAVVAVVDPADYDATVAHAQLLADVVAESAARIAGERDDATALARYDAVVPNASDLVLVIDADGTLRDVSSAGGDLLGFAIAPMLGRNVIELVHPDDVERAVSTLAYLVADPDGPQEPLELRVRNAAGEYRSLRMQANNRLGDGLIGGVVISAHDVTERRQIAKALEVSEAQLRALLNSSADLITVLDADGEVVLSTDAQVRVLGHEGDFGVEDVIRIVHPDDRAMVAQAVTEVFEGTRGPDRPVLLRIATAAGDYRYLESTGDNRLDDPHLAGIVFTSRDVTERMHALEDLRASHAQMRTLLGSMDDGVVLIGADFEKVLYANEAYASIVEMDIEQVWRHSPRDLNDIMIAVLVEPDLWIAQTRAEVQARRAARRVELRTVDGRCFERTYVPVADGDDVYGHLWVFHDVTQRKQSEQSLVDALDDAVRASQVKSEFVATIGHEIRTPMHAVLGMLELVLNGELHDEQRSLLSTMRDSAHMLQRVLDDLLDFSKIEAGRVDIAAEQFDLVTTLDHLVAAVRPGATARGLQVDFVAAPGVPPVVIGDELRLRQIVGNLLDNAVKYTETGRVRVTVERAGVSGAHRCPIRISVTDTGIGIPADVIDTLFEAFVQVDGERRPHIRGTGLGLAISRRLAELMSGRLIAESELGRGSTFTLTVTFETPADDSTRTAAPNTEFESAPAMPAVRVLVVEDDAVNQMLARRQLEHLGHDATVVGSGEDALAVLEHSTFDVVLMDRQLPGIDGLETTARIRESERATGNHVPIIAMTASAFAEDEHACLAAGTDGYVAKPVSLASLRAALDRFLALDPATPSPHQ